MEEIHKFVLEKNYANIQKGEEDKVVEEPVIVHHQAPTFQLDTMYAELAGLSQGSPFAHLLYKNKTIKTI